MKKTPSLSREEVLARARITVEQEWAVKQAAFEQDAAENRAVVAVHRDRDRQLTELQERRLQKESEMSVVGTEIAKSLTHPAPKPSAKSKRSTTKAAIKAGPISRSRPNSAAGRARAEAQVAKTAKTNGDHPVREKFLAAAKKSGVRIVQGNRGGFDVKLVGANNVVFSGRFKSENEAKAAAKAAGLTVA